MKYFIQPREVVSVRTKCKNIEELKREFTLTGKTSIEPVYITIILLKNGKEIQFPDDIYESIVSELKLLSAFYS